MTKIFLRGKDKYKKRNFIAGKQSLTLNISPITVVSIATLGWFSVLGINGHRGSYEMGLGYKPYNESSHDCSNKGVSKKKRAKKASEFEKSLNGRSVAKTASQPTPSFIKAVNSDGGRFRPFSEMTLLQKFVFVLSVMPNVSQVGAGSASSQTTLQPYSNSFPQSYRFDSGICGLNNMTSPMALPERVQSNTTEKISQHQSGKGASKVSKPPTLLEQIGPEKNVKRVFKKSDEVEVPFGYRQASTVSVPLAYKSFSEKEMALKQLHHWISSVQKSIDSDNYGGGKLFGRLVYDPGSGKLTMQSSHKFWRTQTSCFQGMIDEAEAEWDALKSILAYQKNTGNYDEFAKELEASEAGFIESLRAIAGTMYPDLLKAKETLRDAGKIFGVNFDNELNHHFQSDVGALIEGDKKVVLPRVSTGVIDLSKHKTPIDLLKQQWQKLQAFEDKFEEHYGDLQRACLARVAAQNKESEQHCKKQEKIDRARLIRGQVEARQKEVEANRNSFGMKALKTASIVYVRALAALGVTLAVAATTPKKYQSYRRRRVEINTGQIIQKIAKQRAQALHNLEEQMIQCEKAAERSRRSHIKFDLPEENDSFQTFPSGWREPNENDFSKRDYRYPKLSKNERRAKKREENGNKASEAGSFLDKAKQVLLSKNSIPDYPWNEEIPWGHQCIKPIYGKNKHILAHAYCDLNKLANGKSKISDADIKKIREVHESGRYVPHETSAAGYKCFVHNGWKIWEFKLSSNRRYLGFTVKPNREGKAAGVNDLVVFDKILSK
ncbi:hypothetical protein [Endozoicomonas ascidiicola]|uniref:hypothetical protein n=1 Tax=Endozoicomonas ascidiicola TaxID=1698521 RepID=UPI000AB8B1E5|nr:hypothetical protein [Endozoicomonas ascidiicola]